MLKELVEEALQRMIVSSGQSGAAPRFFWLWDLLRQKLEDHGLFGDVLPPAAVTMCSEAPRRLFRPNGADELLPVAAAAFGLEQAQGFFNRGHNYSFLDWLNLLNALINAGMFLCERSCALRRFGLQRDVSEVAPRGPQNQHQVKASSPASETLGGQLAVVAYLLRFCRRCRFHFKWAPPCR